MLELTHVHVLFNFNVNEPVRVEVEVYVNSANSIMSRRRRRVDTKFNATKIEAFYQWIY